MHPRRFFGLYLYDRAGDVARGERRVLAEHARGLDPLLPMSSTVGSEAPVRGKSPHPNGVNGYAVNFGEKGGNEKPWLVPGTTRQEDTWRPKETAVGA